MPGIIQIVSFALVVAAFVIIAIPSRDDLMATDFRNEHRGSGARD
jgi:hypothetical protein